MKKKLSIFAASAALFSSSAIATEMEKCKIVDNAGKGLIKAHKADCDEKGNACKNVAWDPEAWIMVPAGECDKINKGDLSGISEDIQDKIEVDYLPKLALANEENTDQAEAQEEPASAPEDSEPKAEMTESASDAEPKVEAAETTSEPTPETTEATASEEASSSNPQENTDNNQN